MARTVRCRFSQTPSSVRDPIQAADQREQLRRFTDIVGLRLVYDNDHLDHRESWILRKGKGDKFVEAGILRASDGELPFNTDGGGLCSNYLANRGGMTKVIEAIRQLRGEANDKIQVDADIAIAHGTGGSIATHHGAATVVLGGEGR